ncbi:ArnT family glycosyltransferase [Catenovulum sediminis]|uniref:Glycosyltransferase family 39 protein n=1 Tax=Catenovulum sediminis TaxID=1740262 RepID=A0ABV1RE57_9ALTE
MKKFELSHPVVLTAFIFVGFLLNLSAIPLFDVDEGAFSEATREMLNTGVWSATYLDGQPRYDKPILTYWVQAVFVSIFGLNEFGLRMHSVISAALWALACFLFCKEFINRNTAVAVLVIFASTLWITVIGRAATADALLNLFIALSFFDIYRYSQHQQSIHCYRAWLWMSLGMLTKGPVAVAIPAISSLIWLLSLGHFRVWLKAVLNPVGWLIFLSVLTPWLYMVWLEQGSDFFYGFLVEHNLKRFTATKEGHGGSWYYYLLVLPLIILPYSGLILNPIRRCARLWLNPLNRLLIIWFSVVFMLVSISQTQLPHYVLYGVTPLLILFAKYRNLISRQHWQWLFPLAFCAIQFILLFVAPDLAQQQNNLYQQQMLTIATQVFNTHYLIASVILLLLVSVLYFIPLSLWKRLSTAALLQTLFCYTFLIPALAEIQQTPIKQAALQSKDIAQPFVAYKIHMPSFSVYRQDITHRREVKPGDYVYTRADRVSSLQEMFGPQNVRIFYQHGGIVLAEILHNKQQRTLVNVEK